jgi:hypothetical protein
MGSNEFRLREGPAPSARLGSGMTPSEATGMTRPAWSRCGGTGATKRRREAQRPKRRISTHRLFQGALLSSRHECHKKHFHPSQYYRRFPHLLCEKTLPIPSTPLAGSTSHKLRQSWSHVSAKMEFFLGTPLDERMGSD